MRAHAVNVLSPLKQEFHTYQHTHLGVIQSNFSTFLTILNIFELKYVF